MLEYVYSNSAIVSTDICHTAQWQNKQKKLNNNAFNFLHVKRYYRLTLLGVQRPLLFCPSVIFFALIENTIADTSNAVVTQFIVNRAQRLQRKKKNNTKNKCF